jgi:NADPH:quinone reductase-like Zn-dependent oxidoreductase
VIGEDGRVAVMPPNLGYEQAAPATEGAHYALSHIRRAKIGSGHHVLVYGATGAIGSAVQLLKTLGARVTAVCATPHLELVRQLGADEVIDYTAGDFTAGGPDYDVVFDAVGNSSFGRCKRLLKPGGIYMSTGPGPWYQNLILPLAPTPVLGGKKVVFAYPRLDQATVRHFGQLMATGRFTPVIDRHYPLDQVADAYRYVETGQKIGNVVIIVDPSR